MLPQAAERYTATRSRSAALTRAGVLRLWRTLPDELDAAWTEISRRVLAVLMAGQLAAAKQASAYMVDVLAELDIAADPVARVNPGSVVGVAGSGVPLADLMAYPIIATKVAIGRGVPVAVAKQSGASVLDGIVRTQLSDAGRAVESVEVATRPRITQYVRMLQLPSCPRCAILAGRVYKWSTGFQRHNRCDCRMVPAVEDVAGDLRTDPLAAIKAGQVHGLSKADFKAITADGADPGQVINAHRGMEVAQIGSIGKVKFTTGGITKRGFAGARLGDFAKSKRIGRTGKTVRYSESQIMRLRPETVYRLYPNDRPEALRQLYRFGYLLDQPA